MSAILTFILYFLIGAVALVCAFVLIRFIIKAISHTLMIIPEYMWHTMYVLMFIGITVGVIIWLITST